MVQLNGPRATKTPLPCGSGVLRAILVVNGSGRVQPRRSGAKNKHQAKNDYRYDNKAKRARIDGDRGRNRAGGVLAHRHVKSAPTPTRTCLSHLRNAKMEARAKISHVLLSFALAAFCGASVRLALKQASLLGDHEVSGAADRLCGILNHAGSARRRAPLRSMVEKDARRTRVGAPQKQQDKKVGFRV